MNYKKIFLCMGFLILFCLTGCREIQEHAVTDDSAVLETEMTSEETTESEPVVSNVKMTVVGDLMVHKWQMDDALKKGGGFYDFDYCFEPVYDYLVSADLTVGNLETTLAGKEIGYSDYPCFNTPEQFADSLKNAGFDIVSTANNHCMDKGENGLLNTIAYLDKIGIEHYGTYSSKEKSEDIFIKEVNGIRFAFLSYTYGTNGIPVPKGKEYLVNLLFTDKVTADIKKAKELQPDFIIVQPHMGMEYESSPREVYVNQIDKMIECGADIVIASHPHVLQPMEYRTVKTGTGEERKGFVTYSLANFISSQRDKPRDAGVIVNFYFEKINGEAVIKDISYIPTWVQWRDVTGGYNIRVLSVYDALQSADNGNKYGLRPQDVRRVKEVHKESNKTITGEDVAEEESFPANFF